MSSSPNEMNCLSVHKTWAISEVSFFWRNCILNNSDCANPDYRMKMCSQIRNCAVRPYNNSYLAVRKTNCACQISLCDCTDWFGMRGLHKACFLTKLLRWWINDKLGPKIANHDLIALIVLEDLKYHLIIVIIIRI